MLSLCRNLKKRKFRKLVYQISALFIITNLVIVIIILKTVLKPEYGKTKVDPLVFIDGNSFKNIYLIQN